MQTFEVKKIYFDMDGVLADFERGIREICKTEPVGQNAEKKDEEAEDLMWSKVKKAGHFYDLLEMMPGAGEMFNMIYEKYGDRCEILTGIPSPKREIFCAAEDKINWVRRLLSDKIIINTVLRKEKKNFCTGKDCILIDDYAKNITEWTAIGGTGILFKDSAETIKQLKDMGIL
ncbi:MAG: hypothetical protein IKP88_17295 [Lachnospiraceae bacterium]|nr:hypothetical protein [Lachnospiraceae bacterium]